MARIRKGDNVEVISGKDKGKRGEVLQVLPKEGKAVVKGANEAKKHQKPNMANQQGGIMTIEVPVDQSNILPVCPSCSAAVRVGYAVVDDKKVRVCRKCKEQFQTQKGGLTGR